MKNQRARVERAARALLESRLAGTDDPLSRARLKEALGVSLASWTMKELLALRAELQESDSPSAAAVPTYFPLPDLEGLDIESLRQLRWQLERAR